MKPLVKVFAALAAIVLAYGAWIWWDVRQVRSFCHDVVPGIAISQIPVVASRHGVNTHWQEGHGIYFKSTNDWYLSVWAVSTFGDITCAIHHNNVSVVSAAMEGE
jgi:hypothetical protein